MRTFLVGAGLVLVRTVVAQTGPAPAGVQAVAVSASSVTVSWGAGASVRGYAAGRNCSGTPPVGCQANSGALAPTATSWNDAGLAAGTNYAYRVAVQYLDGRIGVTEVFVTTPAVAAPVAQRTPGVTRSLLQQAVITGYSAPKVHPGEPFSVLGTGMGYVTGVVVLVVEPTGAPGKYRPMAGFDPIVFNQWAGDVGRLDIGMPQGTVVRWSGGSMYQRFVHNQPLLVVVNSTAGPDTSKAPVLVDKTPVINAVEKTLVPAGQTVQVSGWNLEEVKAGYLGEGTQGTFSNPKLPAQGYPNGTGAELTTDAECNRSGYLTFETTSPVAATVSSPVVVSCAVKPQVTSVMPPVAAPGTVVQLLGKGLRDVTTVIGTGLPPITWSRVSDGELTVTLPSLPQYDGAVDLFLSLKTNVYGGLYFPVTARPVVVMPPVITLVEPGWGEFNSVVMVHGKGLADFPSPRFATTVMIGGVTAPQPSPVGWPSNSILQYVQVKGSNDPAPMLTLSHLGGSAQAPFIFVSGPSEILAAQPSAVKAGQVLTVVGHNLARALGLCMSVPPGSPSSVMRLGDLERPTTNDTLAVVVPSWATSGPVGVYLRGPPGSQQSACQPSALAVTIVP